MGAVKHFPPLLGGKGTLGTGSNNILHVQPGRTAES